MTYPSTFWSAGIGHSPFPYRLTQSQCFMDNDLSQRFLKRWDRSFSIPLQIDPIPELFKVLGLGHPILVLQKALGYVILYSLTDSSYPSAFWSARIGWSFSIPLQIDPIPVLFEALGLGHPISTLQKSLE